jgi:hypothetical protein
MRWRPPPDIDMKTKFWLSALLIFTATGVAWRLWGGVAVATVAGALLMWLLLHYTRLMKTMQRAAHRPIGTVSSAVMLNARLSKGMSLLQIIGLTHSLGQTVEAQPPGMKPAAETFVWTDASLASVTVVFQRGKARSWNLSRAQSDD